MNELGKKVVVFALLLTSTMHIMNMDKALAEVPPKSILTRAEKKAALLKKYGGRDYRPEAKRIFSVEDYNKIKPFAGHVVMYQIADTKNDYLWDHLVNNYGFISHIIHYSTYYFGYELNPFADAKSIKLDFMPDGGRGKSNHPLVISGNQKIFMRHLTPQEAADFLDKINNDQIYFNQDAWRYSKAIKARLEYRAEEKENEVPSLNVVVKKDREALSQLSVEQAKELLEKMWQRDYFDYYVTDLEKIEIEGILSKIIDQSKKDIIY